CRGFESHQPPQKNSSTCSELSCRVADSGRCDFRIWKMDNEGPPMSGPFLRLTILARGGIMAPAQKPLIFISHIHEEGALAKLFKDTIETEFGGFVEVFVSSDHEGIARGPGIAAGSHFVEAVESGLVNCIAAFYLISPKSVRRPWVNFELGAVWCRGAVQKASGGDRIMALPVCHSGVTPSGLPAPLNALNAISATRASDLEFAFESLQRTLGVSGSPLRTDFQNFAASAKRFEDLYTIGEVLARNLHETLTVRDDVQSLIDHCRNEAKRGGQTVHYQYLDGEAGNR
ncbi:toll/interleukin-1 receptor domain-containing protein, partial [Burkholderia multivorans]|uniref:toll/interleukin-1 receptor domain-containing protein n=3 Tax=Burkholderia multivorans TaxID=87883 RepID=UPI000ADEB7CF